MGEKRGVWGGQPTLPLSRRPGVPGFAGAGRPPGSPFITSQEGKCPALIVEGRAKGLMEEILHHQALRATRRAEAPPPPPPPP